ncbi:transcriptional regulator, TetR family [Micromonospora sediminicola]|uniref:Transcriptional regulator, TetR family n=1 Tax=Micromonospora sediminicola TaxID=946078 RepID=A0A1A9BBJ3_9ACTN|nr:MULTISPECIES: TetR family transcriptional regulator C-terminal domain-containing protein [Micromonospora]PGH44717.1 TetR family transcriptional regulator [Micromonospora sp. WMMA1996]SBT66518.1 transcriptional regulator, TetR family [Micromonospora sediminicola]
MPKIVDHDARRAELAAAMWRVVYRDGVGAATVRSIAAEAGWSPSALRHYFATQTELLVFAMEHVMAEAAGRFTAEARTGPPREVAQRMLEELLPLDRQRVREAEVWLLLAARAQVDPAARERMTEADEGVRLAAELAVTLLSGGQPADDAATARLHALLDGLTLHALLHPDRMPPHRIRDLLAAHLDQLAAAGAPS